MTHHILCYTRLHMFKKITLKKSLPLLFVIVASFGTFFYLFSELLAPTYIDWILNIKSDPFQHFISGFFYRIGPWTFPLNAPMIAYPTGISIVFTDAIPIFAIFFKLLYTLGLLPQAPIQYFGIWLLLCFLLQGLVSYALLKKITASRVLSALGSILFLLSPPMLLRMRGHFALSAHFLILLSLFFYAYTKTTKQTVWWWGSLFVISLLVHPYLFMMVGFLYAADMVRTTFITKLISFRTSSLIILGHVILVLCTMYAAGYFAIGSGVSVGFGAFSMNVLSVFNTSDQNGLPWSRIIAPIATAPYQYEGFNYLGIGILVQLLLFIVFITIQPSLRKKCIDTVKQHWPLAIIIVGLTFFSMSTKVYIGTHLLFNIPLPGKIEHLFNIFRSSGRFFWPVYYVLMLISFAIYTLIQKRTLRIALLCTVIALQIFDFFPKLQEINTSYESIAYTSSLRSPEWERYGTEYAHVSFVPHVSPGIYEDVSFWAATHHMTINSMYTARPAKDEVQKQIQMLQDIKNGILSPDTIYIFQIADISGYISTSTTANGTISQLDEYTILTKKQ